MNILTFDIEEWYIEKEYHTANTEQYQIFDRYLKSILELLDKQNLKATFFCVGGLGKYFPEIVKVISEHGHEIGCHSNKHLWLSTLNRNELKQDTETAIKTLEDLIGKKIISYRAPAFSIGKKNKWAFEILADCGIERDASIYPSVRDFGGFDDFPAKKPCIIKMGDVTIKEFPICLTNILGKDFAYSGGGYFRLFPFWYIKNAIAKSNYVITYFHIGDLVYYPMKLRDKESFESYFKLPGTLKNRTIRMIKDSLGTKGAFEKMCKLVESYDYASIEQANELIDWEQAKIVNL